MQPALLFFEHVVDDRSYGASYCVIGGTDLEMLAIGLA
jgi:hypothetical protein